MLNEMYELKEGYSINESAPLGEKLCKKLHIIDGFRFMTLANDLNEEQVRLYEPDKSRVSSISTRNDFIIGKPYVDVDFGVQRANIKAKRLITMLEIKTLEEKLLNADSEESEILSQRIRNLELDLRTLDSKIRRLNRRAHMMGKESERNCNTTEIGLERQSNLVLDEEIDLNHKYMTNTEFMGLLREYQRLRRLIDLTRNQIDIATDDLKIQELLDDLQTYEQIIQPIRRKIEEYRTEDDSEEDLF